MKTRHSHSRNKRKFSLLLSVATVFAAAFIIAQLMFAPSLVQTVHAGSTLTPTPVPMDTPTPEPPPPTDTPVPPAPTHTPAPSNNGGSNSSPAPEPSPTPIIPQEIPELGVGSSWHPLFFTLLVLIVALVIAGIQVRYLLKETSNRP